MNVQHLCRACLAPSKQMYPIFNDKGEVESTNVVEMLQILVDSPILPTDKASHNICDDCLNKLREIHSFKLTCKQSEHTFQQLSESQVRIKRLKDPREYLEFVIDVGINELPLVSQNDNYQNNHNLVHVGYNGMDGTVQPICDLTMDSENEIQSDQEEVADEIFECPACLDAFGMVSVLRTHLIEVHTSESSCIMCNNEYFDDIWAHTKTHVPKKHACNDCGKKFIRGSTLEQHAQTHLLKPMVPCGHCGQCFMTESELDEHISNTHNFLCKTCWKTFSSRRSLLRHQKIHLRVGDYKCDVCGRKFKKEESYNCHLLDHYNSYNESSAHFSAVFTPYDLVEENSSMQNDSTVFEHINSTIADLLAVDKEPKMEDDKKYQCDVCSKYFRDRACLTDHSTIHTGARPFACQFCDKRFRVKRNLRQHVISHSRETPFVCGICGNRYKKRQFILTHIQHEHSEESAFPCGICSIVVTNTTELTRHWRYSHTVAYSDVNVLL